jgi:hypothetical protein
VSEVIALQLKLLSILNKRVAWISIKFSKPFIYIDKMMISQWNIFFNIEFKKFICEEKIKLRPMANKINKLQLKFERFESFYFVMICKIIVCTVSKGSYFAVWSSWLIEYINLAIRKIWTKRLNPCQVTFIKNCRSNNNLLFSVFFLGRIIWLLWSLSRNWYHKPRINDLSLVRDPPTI